MKNSGLYISPGFKFIRYDKNDPENPGIEIKPCPFCGSKARTLPQDDGWIKIKCQNYTCAELSEFTEYEMQVMAKWNRRVLPNGHVVNGLNDNIAYDENGKGYIRSN